MSGFVETDPYETLQTLGRQPMKGNRWRRFSPVKFCFRFLVDALADLAVELSLALVWDYSPASLYTLHLIKNGNLMFIHQGGYLMMLSFFCHFLINLVSFALGQSSICLWHNDLTLGIVGGQFHSLAVNIQCVVMAA